MAAISNSKIVCVCLMLSFGGYANSFDGLSIMDIKDILRFGVDTMRDVLESWEMIRPKSPGDEENTLPFVYRMEKELRNSISRVSDNIEIYQNRMEMRVDAVVAKLLTDLPLQEKLDQNLRMLDQYIGQINDLYYNFVMYVTATTKYERYTLEDFARTCVSSRSGALPDLLKRIHRLLVPHPDADFNASILVLLANKMQEAAMQVCSEQQSLQQLLYNLYSTITLTEIKGYSMIQFSYMLLRLYHPGSNFTEEMELVKEQYAVRTSETVRAVKTAMAFAPRDLWRCDARTPKLDETYTQLTKLFQGYIVNEVDLNKDSNCKENCAYYQYSKVHGCYQNQYCAQQRKCHGKILNCEYIDSDMWICPSAKNSDRRYEYIQYENGKIFGSKDTCRAGTTKVDSWWRWLFWHCSYCFCYCDDHSANSDRYFSLRKVMSDVANNKVITGIALKKVNQIIHMQIQEGELIARGNINKTSISWKPIEAFSVLDSNVKSNVDYHTLAWEKRGLDLDDLVPAQDHLLTGVKFRTVGSRLNLEIMVTPFNFTTGKLIHPLEKSFWLSNDVTDRTELVLATPDIPTRLSLPTLPDSKANQYLNFAPSDRVTDAAQNTIPFLDIQPLETTRPVPIAGAGIFHKGRKRSGGYVALKLITYDFTSHLQVDLSPETPIIGTPSQPSEIKAV
ncbi:chemokine-like protein orion isoform X1 [Andrena cerasifolii]|uniref:chemokine-like protein orion isoform X1 n=1 Tax=Andrena cerasifolii TaxID=2819439 RepID=UPI0040376052